MRGKTYVCAKYVRKEHTRHSGSTAAVRVKNTHKAPQTRARDPTWTSHSGHEMTFNPSRYNSIQELCTESDLIAVLAEDKTNNRATVFYESRSKI